MIREATAADVPHVARVQLRSALAGFAHIFPESIPKPTEAGLEPEWAALVASEDTSVVLAEDHGDVVGVVAYGPDPLPRRGTDSVLRKLYVVPEQFGNGIGTQLYERAITDLAGAGYTRVRLWVLEQNLTARRMYERRGWRLQPWSRSDWPGSGILELGYTLDLDYSSAM
ncbi:MAG: GNAT family N-acetyltransferase [Acidimicrobiia bacterium]|nr:GNAT family N-acetyltransferase [Acidimicrobiia bacterium]